MLSASYVHLFDLLVATLSQAPSSYVTITRAEVIHHPVQSTYRIHRPTYGVHTCTTHPASTALVPPSSVRFR